MAISVGTKGSPGWWLAKGFAKIEERAPRLNLLNDWHEGNPPAPTAVQTAREAFRDFEEEAVTNFAELIVGAVRERMTVRDIRTGESGEKSDDVAWGHWVSNNLSVEMSSVIETFLALGDSYMIVGKDPETEKVVVTAEDPRQLVTFHNPLNQQQLRAAVKVLHDPDEGRAFAVLMLRGGKLPSGAQFNARRFVAYMDTDSAEIPAFDAGAWTWDPDQGGPEGEELPHQLVPVVRFRNRNGKGEFEDHIKILRRINRSVFQLTVIVMYQAYKQRAVILDDSDEDDVQVQNSFKEEIGIGDLDDALTSDPGSWFLLPRGAKIWESTQTDVQGILSAIKDDVMRLAAVTRRPMAIFAPDNQSAGGAEFTREGLTFATEDKMTRADQGIVDLFHLIFLTAGDEARADRSKIMVGWKPSVRYSLTDMASATSQVSGTMPKRTIYREIWQKTPAEIMQIESEASDELLLMQENDSTGDLGMSAEELAGRAEAIGRLQRAAVTGESAARAVGLEGLEFNDGRSTSLKFPDES